MTTCLTYLPGKINKGEKAGTLRANWKALDLIVWLHCRRHLTALYYKYNIKWIKTFKLYFSDCYLQMVKLLFKSSNQISWVDVKDTFLWLLMKVFLKASKNADKIFRWTFHFPHSKKNFRDNFRVYLERAHLVFLTS